MLRYTKIIGRNMKQTFQWFVLKIFFIPSLFTFSKLSMYKKFENDNEISSVVAEYEKLVNWGQ